MKIAQGKIHMIRGDSAELLVSCKQEDGTVRKFETGDNIYFTVKQYTNVDEIILQKKITSFIDGAALISILPEDTKGLMFVERLVLKYDVQLSARDGRVMTIVPPNDFIVEGEVTFE